MAHPCSRSFSVLLLFVVAGAAAEVAAQCDVPRLAAEVAASCPAVEPTLTAAPCCRAVVAAVHLGRCFCLVAAEKRLLHEGINATTMVSLYRSCGGTRAVVKCHGHEAPAAPSASGRTSPAGVYLRDGKVSSASLVHRLPQPGVVPASRKNLDVVTAPPQAAALGARKLPSTCNPHLLAGNIVDDCTDKMSPTDRCCIAVVAAVDIRGCLCAVALDSSIIDSGEDITAYGIMNLYVACGGIRRLPESLTATCKGEPVLPPPPPPPPHIGICDLNCKDESMMISLEVTQIAQFLAGVIFIIYKAYKNCCHH